jgi:hypothetical protein
MAVTHIPRLSAASKHRAVIALRILYQARVLLSEKVVIGINTTIA